MYILKLYMNLKTAERHFKILASYLLGLLNMKMFFSKQRKQIEMTHQLANPSSCKGLDFIV